MATLTKSTGTVTLSGAAERVTFPASYGWVWVKNMSDSDIFAGLSADISEGADGALTIPAGECGRVQTDGFSSVYLLGTGNALVVAQNYADCPFKVGGKGGEIPDLSAYAKKTDIPTELPANGGNADTVGLKSPIEFIHASASRSLETSLNDLSIGTFCCEDRFTPDFPKKADGSSYGQFGLLDFRNYGSILYQTMMFENGTVIHRARVAHLPDWTPWKEISTTPIKSVGFSGTTGNSGNMVIWDTSERKIPLFAEIVDCYCFPFLSSSNAGCYMIHAFDSNGDKEHTAVSGTVYYIEV